MQSSIFESKKQLEKSNREKENEKKNFLLIEGNAGDASWSRRVFARVLPGDIRAATWGSGAAAEPNQVGGENTPNVHLHSIFFTQKLFEPV